MIHQVKHVAETDKWYSKIPTRIMEAENDTAIPTRIMEAENDTALRHEAETHKWYSNSDTVYQLFLAEKYVCQRKTW